MSQNSDITVCSICYGDELPLITDICSCRGTVAWRHEPCLKKWIEHSTSKGIPPEDALVCSLCKMPYKHYFEEYKLTKTIIIKIVFQFTFGLFLIILSRALVDILIGKLPHLLMPLIDCVVKITSDNHFQYEDLSLSITKCFEQSSAVIAEAMGILIAQCIFFLFLFYNGCTYIMKSWYTVRGSNDSTVSLLRFRINEK